MGVGWGGVERAVILEPPPPQEALSLSLFTQSSSPVVSQDRVVVVEHACVSVFLTAPFFLHPERTSSSSSESRGRPNTTEVDPCYTVHTRFQHT